MSNSFQKIHGSPSESVKNKITNYLTPVISDFIKQSPFLVMASANTQGACDASPKGGIPGFVKILNERHLFVPDIAGNKLFQSYENMEANPQIGLIFFIPGNDRTCRVNGSVQIVQSDDKILSDQKISTYFKDENTKLIQGLLITVEEAYTHCPRALKFSNLWGNISKS